MCVRESEKATLRVVRGLCVNICTVLRLVFFVETGTHLVMPCFDAIFTLIHK